MSSLTPHTHTAIPLIVVRSYGLVGYLRIVTPSHVIIDQKAQFSHTMLGFTRDITPFRELVDVIDLNALNSIDFSHIPWPVLLWKARDVFVKESGDGVVK